MNKTIATLFSGFDLAGQGAKAAGYKLAWGIEKEPAIAEVGNFNHGDHINVASILDCDPYDFERPGLLWASPPSRQGDALSAGFKQRQSRLNQCAMPRPMADTARLLCAAGESDSSLSGDWEWGALRWSTNDY